MKKLTPRYRNWLRHRQRCENERRRRAHFEVGFLTTQHGTFAVRLGSRSEPPQILCFDTNFEETAAFLDLVRRRTVMVMRGGIFAHSSKHRSVLPLMKAYHDFSVVKRVSTGAALVLASLYDVRRHFTGTDQPAVRLMQWDPSVRQTMRDLGFFELLGIESAVPAQPNSDQMTSKFRAGVKVDPTQIGGPESVLESIFSFMGMSNANKVPLYTAIIEAMNNVRDHAYPDYYFHRRRHIKNWWFTASADRITKRLTIAFYDQGISIPVSLPRTRGLQPLISAFLKDFSLTYNPEDPHFDGQAISAAMKPTATATGASNRGFGLAKIREMVDALPAGKLRIISRHGEFVASAGQQPVVQFKNNPLRGTLVEIEASFA